MFTRLETRGKRPDIKDFRRDLAEEFRAQRQEIAAQVSAIANAINATRR